MTETRTTELCVDKTVEDFLQFARVMVRVSPIADSYINDICYCATSVANI